MKKDGSNNNKPYYALHHDKHESCLMSALCSMIEHQSLVDVALRCGNTTIHAHKVVLAANSLYFREQLEKNAGTEQIIINGLDFPVLKGIIEYMYCGETHVLEGNFQYIIAAALMFKIRGLQALESEMPVSAEIIESINIPPPTFLTKKPKYSTPSLPSSTTNNTEKTQQTEANFSKKMKRKYMRNEAEKACAKEAAASRMALEALKKELATNQVSSFVIEESCTETTVENFIPHGEEVYIDNVNQLATLPVQVVNYDLNDPTASTFVQKPEETPTEKLKQIIGKNLPTNVEIMFKTSDGSFVKVTDEMLQNITTGPLQYQVIDENGQASEPQELQVDNKIAFTENNLLDIPCVDTERTNNLIQSSETPSQPIQEDILAKAIPNDYELHNLMISNNTDSCPIFIPSSTTDPLSEACSIAENLTSSFSNKGQFGCSAFDDISNTISMTDSEMHTNIGNQYLIKDQNFMEFSPRKLRSSRRSSATNDNDKKHTDHKKKN